jgi:hypothetical protein
VISIPDLKASLPSVMKNAMRIFIFALTHPTHLSPGAKSEAFFLKVIVDRPFCTFARGRLKELARHVLEVARRFCLGLHQGERLLGVFFE